MQFDNRLSNFRNDESFSKPLLIAPFLLYQITARHSEYKASETKCDIHRVRIFLRFSESLALP